MATTVRGHHVQGSTRALMVVTAIFFMWGFLTCLNDILIPHLKASFALSWVQAMLIQFTFFGAYFLMSLPAGWWLRSATSAASSPAWPLPVWARCCSGRRQLRMCMACFWL